MRINGLQKLTLLDFPGHTACTVFVGGCNFRCPFCHNAPLVLRSKEQPVIELQELLSFLKKRQGLLEGVCVTGGEPTLYDDLPQVLRQIRELGYLVKLDTNGYKPEMLKRVVREGLCDYVAMDIKSSPSRYPVVAGVPDMDVAPILESAAFLMEGHVPFEFRTTVVEELHDIADFEDIGVWLKGAPQYFVQCFKDSGDLIEQGFSSPKNEKIDEIVRILQENIPNAQARGED
jgi:pyruvate formate lyase activating enzyme